MGGTLERASIHRCERSGAISYRVTLLTVPSCRGARRCPTTQRCPLHLPHLEVPSDIGQRLDHQPGNCCEKEGYKEATNHCFATFPAGSTISATRPQHIATESSTAAAT